MLLSINQAKVAELLNSTNKGYAVNSIEILPAVDTRDPEPIIVEISGISYSTNSYAQPKEDAVFGTHVREAVGIVKDWAGRK
jgi:hypothetical protein